MTFISCAVAAQAQDGSNTNAPNHVGEIVELCSKLEDGAETVTDRLERHGWLPTNNREVLVSSLASIVLTRDIAFIDDARLKMIANSDDPSVQFSYLLENSAFMSASILGNSALPANQPVYEKDGYALAALGLSLDAPYCIASGPINFGQMISSSIDFAEETSETPPLSGRSGVTVTIARSADVVIYAAHLEPSTVLEAFGNPEIQFEYAKSADASGFFYSLPVQVIQITPSSTHEIPQ